MTATAQWNGVELAKSDATVVVEGNHYFPLDSVDLSHFTVTDTHTICPWKGEASYYDIAANGETNSDAAWFYPTPLEAAKEIKDHVAFWKGVTVTET
ncbi:MAG: DUF427 domain-containing protein [Acidimicrobiales bacterium]